MALVGCSFAFNIGPKVAPILELVICRLAPNGGNLGFSSFVIGASGMSTWC